MARFSVSLHMLKGLLPSDPPQPGSLQGDLQGYERTCIRVKFSVQEVVSKFMKDIQIYSKVYKHKAIADLEL